MHANLPKIAKRWEKDYASGGIARLGFYNGNTVAPFPGIQQNNMLTNMQSMSPLALSVMTGQHQPGISPHRGGYNPIDPYGNIQMGLEKDDIRSGAQVQKQPAWYNRMFNKVGQGITGLTNKVGQGITGLTNKMGGMFTGGKNLGANIIGMAMGIPGLGAMLGSIRPDTPYERFQKQMFSDMYGGYDFGNKDPFGKNVRSIFGNYDVTEQFDDLAGSKLGEKYGYEAAMADGVVTDEELEEMQEKGLKGFQLERFQALAAANKKAKDWKDKKKTEKFLTDRMKDGSFDKTSTYKGTPGGNTGSGSFKNFDNTGKTYGPHGGSYSSNRPNKSGNSGHTNPGRGSYGPHFAQGGIVSLWRK